MICGRNIINNELNEILKNNCSERNRNSIYNSLKFCSNNTKNKIIEIINSKESKILKLKDTCNNLEDDIEYLEKKYVKLKEKNKLLNKAITDNIDEITNYKKCIEKIKESVETNQKIRYRTKRRILRIMKKDLNLDCEDCPICTKKLSESVTHCKSCYQKIHIDCINKCLEKKDDCPFCRGEFS